MTNNLVPFGKYKGQPVEALRSDQSYVDWLVNQDWFQAKYKNIYTVVINNFGEPAETPDHNAMQIKFLDKTWLFKFLHCFYRSRGKQYLFELHIDGSDIQNKIVDTIDKSLADCQSLFSKALIALESKCSQGVDEDSIKNAFLHNEWHDASKQIKRARSIADLCISIQHPNLSDFFVPSTSVLFEDCGFDVTINASLVTNVKCEISNATIFCEMKPSMGDDYPAVMRQIKANYNRISMPSSRYVSARQGALCLVLGKYSGIGATFDQVKTMFATEGITIVEELSVDAVQVLSSPMVDKLSGLPEKCISLADSLLSDLVDLRDRYASLLSSIEVKNAYGLWFNNIKESKESLLKDVDSNLEDIKSHIRSGDK